MAPITLGLLLWLPILVAARFRTPAALSRYFINWDGGMRACKGANNTIFDLGKLRVNKVNVSTIGLVGDVELTRSTTKAIKFTATINKEVNGNYEYFLTITQDNLCTHISEKSRPWTPFIKEMGIIGCPIPKKVYSFKDSSLDTAGFPLTAAQAGKYQAKIELWEEGVRTVCMLADVNVQQL